MLKNQSKVRIKAPVTTLSTRDNAKLLEQLEFGFKRKINWNKYQTKVSTERKNQYLNFLIDPSFWGVNRLFALPFKNETQRTSYKGYYLLTREIKSYVMWCYGWWSKRFLSTNKI